MTRLLAVAVLLALQVGCMASGTQRARTAGKGVVQVGLEPAASWPVPDEGGPRPNLDVAVRYGVTERFDLGGRLSVNRLELQTKARLTGTEGVIVALGPRLGGTTHGHVCADGGEDSWCGGISSWNLDLPVLIDLPTGPRSAVVLGPAAKLVHVRSPSQLSPLWTYLGGSVGYAASFGGSFTLLPELAWFRAACCTMGQIVPVTDPTYDILHVRLGFLFGQRFDGPVSASRRAP